MWMISKNGKKSKPISEQMVHELIAAGKLSGQDLAQKDGTNDWTPIEDCQEFQNHFESEPDPVKPPPFLPQKSASGDDEAPRVVPIPELKSKTKKPQTNTNIQANKPGPDISYILVQVFWSLSFLGFLFFWLIFDASVNTGNGTRVMNMGQMAVQSNCMMGFAVLLIIISLYMMLVKTSQILTRIEKALSEKMKEEA